MTDLDTLRAAQPGAAWARGDEGYDDAVRLPGPPVAPDVVVRPTTAEEVAAALRWASGAGVDVAVRSGGHGAWVPVPGGLLVDLGALAGVEVRDGVVRVGPGAVWGVVADALAPHGLAISSGDTRAVGVGGNVLGAGIGWLARLAGLAVDQLVGAQVATADGRVVETSADENPDLFFGLRGGGGNFGVATRLDFRPVPVGHVCFGAAPVDPALLAPAVCAVRDALRTADRRLAVTVLKPPPLGPDVPTMVVVLWAGDDEAEARAALAPVLAAPGVGPVDLHVVPYASALASPPDLPPGPPPRMPSSNGLFRELTDEVVHAAVAVLAANPSALFEVRFLGGAVADVPPDATALAWRDAEAIVHWIAFLPPDTPDAEVERVEAAWRPVLAGAEAVCGTFTDETGPDVVERMYPPATLARLRAVKATWDPDNLFRRNHNIPPA